ncbi:MAG: Poly-beta-1,6-N-acetyl-D-glucosamine synthase [Candidatus Omnitrophica bacterium ADurb.Bin277]|nr:MAG: Poly-beta-1,6-N-acetyl-D-glucosamine synthase [Candidatus Omnitrophica bacterium ADurb.Bin277]
MNFIYSRQGLSGREETLQRFFEILPGTASWFLAVGFVAIAFWQPVTASVLVIVFMLSWVFRLLYYTIFLMLSYARLRHEKNTDWISRIKELGSFDEEQTKRLREKRPGGPLEAISTWTLLRDLDSIRKRKAFPPPFDDIFHLVIIPVVKERRAVVEANLEGILRNGGLLNRILVVIALEERAPEEVKKDIHSLKEEYSENLFDLQIIEHPDGIAGEARVKGANISFAARAAAEIFVQKGIPVENVIVSCFDSDTVVGPDYFPCLTYSFMTCPDRYRASFQPIPVYHNNIWKVPGFARVVETGASFFQLIETTDPEKLVTFSSHSMSFRALVDVGYWPVDMISDDSGIFWKAYLHFEGDYRVVPMPVTVSMDVVDSGSWWRTCLSLYKQKRRWAWGVENFPLIMRGFFQSKKISLYDKIRHAFKMFEGHVTWAALPFLLTFVGWLPVILAGMEFSNTVLYYNAGRITQAIFSLSSVAVIGTAFLSTRLLPPKEKRFNLFWTLVHSLEWLLVPVVLLFLSALPALDAQTRLMMGHRMEFWVSDKRRDVKL